MQRWLTYLLIIFGLLPFQISPKFFSFYRAPWLKGWAGHTSSTVQSELLLVIEYTTYMIVTCTQSPLMSLLESWNWCFFLSPWMLKIFEEDIWFRLPNRRVASFILSFLVMYTLRPSTSLQMPNIELHQPGIEPGPTLIECGRSTIELWNLYKIWVC